MNDRSSPDSRYGLLPCPFCGAPARTDLLPHAQGPGWVQCSACECDQHMSDTLEEAVIRWNTRATPSPIAQSSEGESAVAATPKEQVGPSMRTLLARAICNPKRTTGPVTLTDQIDAIMELFAAVPNAVAQPVAATLKGAVEPRTGAGSLD